MTTADVVAVLTDAGFTPSAANGVVVVADRPVLGVAHAFRCVICQSNHDGTWRATMFRKTTARKAGIAYDYQTLKDGRGLPLRCACLADRDDLALFVGGACSVPWGRAEVLAIQAST